MPVNREHCPQTEPGPKTLKVKWKVAFSSSSPGRLVLANVVGFMAKYNMTDTEFNKAKAQHTAQNLRKCYLCVDHVIASHFLFAERLHGHQFSKDSWAGLSALLIGLQCVTFPPT